MAATKSLLLQFGDGGSPEVFAINCTINTNRTFKTTVSTVDAALPNCNDLDAPSWTLRAADTFSADISGAGTLDPVSFNTLNVKHLAGQAINVRVKMDLALASGGGYWVGRYLITDMEVSKEGKGYLSCTMTLASDGEVIWVPAAA